MLKLIDYRTKTKGLPDLLPYAALVEPGVILNKDGSFTAGWAKHFSGRRSCKLWRKSVACWRSIDRGTAWPIRSTRAASI